MNLLKYYSISVVLAIVSLTLSISAFANEAKGLEIAKERIARDEGWGDSAAEVIMLLQNASGDSSKRVMRMSLLEIAEDGDKSLTVFDEPRDVKGTIFLSYSHINQPDDQWLYLPALKRVKRISSKNKSGSFMGSEFAYEDLNSFEIEKFRFNYWGDEVCGDQECTIVEQIPTDEFSGYSLQKVWVDKTHYRPMKIEYFSPSNTLLKTLVLEDYKIFLGRYWRSMKMVMTNHQTGYVTTLTTKDMMFNTGLNKNDFSKSSLKRTR